MSSSEPANKIASLSVSNIGGISESSVTFERGVTLLTGRNATNRTSLLQAIMASLGSDSVTLKGDADRGKVELTIGDSTYTREFRREGDKVISDGDPYLNDPTIADLFAFLLEGNDVRQAIRTLDDLRDIIMRPIDTVEIENEIERKRGDRDELDSRISKLDQLQEELPTLEEERTELIDEIEQKKQELAELEERIDGIDEQVKEDREEREALEQKLEQLNEVRSQLESVRQQIDTQRDSIDALQDEHEEITSQLEDIGPVQEGRIEGINSEIQRLRTQKNEADADIDRIQTVVEFNEDLIDGDVDLFGGRNDEGDVTDQLLGQDREITCWTCGSQTEASQIEEMIAELRELRDEHRQRRRELSEQIEELSDQRQSLQERSRNRSELEERLQTIDAESEERKSRISELSSTRDELTADVKTLESEVEELRAEDDQDSELLDLRKEANRLDVEIEQLERERESVENDISEIEESLAERENLETRREEIQAEIEDLRTRVQELETSAVDKFNGHMESVLTLLQYDNIDRIWIERTEKEVREGREKVRRSYFDLHVVRSTDSGTVYEDTVEHLSESEREVVGLVFALAGYLVHEVYEDVPFMLIDSIESIDPQRIADIIDYFSDYANYLVVALLEEDARVLSDAYRRVTEI